MKGSLAILALLQAGPADGWWDREWTCRRRIAVRNNLEGTLKAGHQVQIEIDAAFLGLQQKARPDLSDLALVHAGKPLAFSLLPSPVQGRRILWFRAAEDIGPSASDGRYALYYGNPAAPAAPAGSVFEFFEDFSRPETFKDKFEADPDLTLALRDGALVFQDVAANRTAAAPARLVLKGAPPGEGFSLSFDVEVQASNASVLGFSVDVDLQEAAAEAPEAGRRIDELIEKLGDGAWEEREKATQELIRIGKPALPKLLEAVKSPDAEVKWRAEHVLREIRERFPPSTISAGVAVGDPQVGPVALTHAIGKNRGRTRHPGGWPLRLHVEVRRAPDGGVTVLWNQGKPQTGHLPGPLRQVSLGFYRAAGGPPSTVRIDNILLRRHVDEDQRPTYSLEVEETRP